MQNAAVDRSGLTEHRVAVRAACCRLCMQCAVARVVARPSWSMFALGSPWDPRRREPRPQIARRNWDRQIGNSRSGREPCRRSHGDQRRPAGPIHLLWDPASIVSRAGPLALFCFLPAHPLFRSLPSPSLLQPHSTLCLDRRLLPRPIPNWPVVLGLLTSCVVRPCFSRPFRHSVIPRRLRPICYPEAAATFFPHSIRNTKL